jgi:hypothetical protein
MRVSICWLALAAALSSSAALAQDVDLRDLSVVQATAAQVVAPHPGALATVITADRADATYAVGETARLTLTANQDAFVTVLDIGPTGTVAQLFPNRFQTDNRLAAGQPVEIAGPATGAHIAISPPTGTELIKVIASNKPLVVVPEAQLQGAGPFRIVDGGVPALMRDLSVVANPPAPNDTLIAFGNFALYTIPVRPPQTAGVVVVAPAQPAPAAAVAHVAIPADQPFPLLLAADKTKYRIGGKPTIAVTTTQACNLTVLEFNAAGVARTLYPTAAAPNPAIAAQQAVFVAGAPGADLTLAGPAGVEQVLAICTTGEATAATPSASVDAATVAKNLAVVANTPGTAMASVTFLIQP